MRWIRVTIHDCSKLKLPDVCPNCLQSPADTPTPIFRTIGGPFVGTITTRMDWPFCSRCSAWTARSSRWSTRCAIIPAGILAVAALVVTLFRAPGGPVVSSLAAWLLFASVVVAVVGCFIIRVIHWLIPRPDSCISNFPTVKPLRGGTTFFSSRTFALLEFLNPLYVEALIEANEPENIKCSARRLAKAKASLLKWADKRAASRINQIVDHPVQNE